MRLRHFWMAAALCSATVLAGSDADTRARDYVQFLVHQLDQWTSDLPQAYNMAMVRPPVDATKLSEPEKAGATNLRESIQRLAVLSQAKELAKNPEFRVQLQKTVQAAEPVNAALGKQRFPEGVELDWAQIRTTLNSLAAIYQYPELAVLEIPPPPSASRTLAAIPAGAVTGYVVDQRCAASGKAMWTSVSCVQKCVRDGDKVVLVTEAGKVFQFSSQEKIDAESYGRKVAVTGKTEGDIITVATLQIL